LLTFLLVVQTVQDCVLYYYLSKMSANYKQMVRRHLSKRRTKLQKVGLTKSPLLSFGVILLMAVDNWTHLL